MLVLPPVVRTGIDHLPFRRRRVGFLSNHETSGLYLMSDTDQPVKRGRGRPPKDRGGHLDTRAAMIRAGLEALTEKGFVATGLDDVLRRVQVPKGSFYHYFESKEAFGGVLIYQYAEYFAAKLDRFLLNDSRAPLDRVSDFVADAESGMARHGYKRGCLVGNLGQEMGALPVSFRTQLIEVFEDWQSRMSACLQLAQVQGAIAKEQDTDALAAFFWIGWEGAVLRAKLERSPEPLRVFATGFFKLIATPHP